MILYPRFYLLIKQLNCLKFSKGNTICLFVLPFYVCLCLNVLICPQGICPFQAFSSPPESFCDRVYTEGPQRTSTSPLDTGCNGNPAIDQTEEYTDPAIALAPDVQNEKPLELVETRHPGSCEESTALLSSENSPLNPYRSQSSVEVPAPVTSKQRKHVTVKQQEKTAPVTVYVTLNMFEQGQGR